MDYSSFCREIYMELSSRLPVYPQNEKETVSLARQGGWYYPSARDKDAWFFDLRKAYRHYLSGMDCLAIADALESAFLKRQWEKLEKKMPPPSHFDGVMDWALKIQPEKEKERLPRHAYYLCWDKYILQPFFRPEDKLIFQPLFPVEAGRKVREEKDFWKIFWGELIRQDPPALLTNFPRQPRREILLGEDGFQPIHRPEDESYILTSQRKIYGAAAIFYPGLLKKISLLLSDFFVVLTSPHEAMIFPGNSGLMHSALKSALEDMAAASLSEDKSFPPSIYQYAVGRGLFSC